MRRELLTMLMPTLPKAAHLPAPFAPRSPDAGESMEQSRAVSAFGEHAAPVLGHFKTSDLCCPPLVSTPRIHPNSSAVAQNLEAASQRPFDVSRLPLITTALTYWQRGKLLIRTCSKKCP